ncbi:MAG: hypothetical protein OXF93_18265, partial [Acidobacteria bacterium]|nr:hypothetical protein [Acidobacteriota bacterium]
RRGVVDQPLGQRRRHHQLALRGRDEGVSQFVRQPMRDALTWKSFDRGATDGFYRDDPIFDPV